MRINWRGVARQLPRPAIGAALLTLGGVGLLISNANMPTLPTLPKQMEINVPNPQLIQQPPQDVAVPPASAPASKQLDTSIGWQQDFARLPAGVLDSKIWKFEIGGDGWGNNEVQYYTNRSTNARVASSHLVIEAKREDYSGRKYTSARLTTQGIFQMQYGRIVFHDVVLPQGVGTWPALWLWPVGAKYSKTQLAGSGDSGLANGEIDILEYVGAEPGLANASAHSYAHYPGHGERSGQTHIVDNLPHDFSLDWTPEQLVFSVNDKPYYTVKNPHTGPADWPYDQPYFLVVNLAMGGDWGGMARDTYPPDGIDGSKTSWQFSVGSITYYPLK